MADKIQYIDNVGGDHIYPVTHERGVLDDEGNSIERKLQHAADVDGALTSETSYTNEQLLGLPKNNYFINNETGNYNSNVANKHLRIEVDPGDIVYVTANSTYNAGIAFLKTNADAEASGTPDYATGWSNVSFVQKGTVKRFVAPTDANRLYIYAGASDNDYNRTPSGIVIRKVNAVTTDSPLMKVSVPGKGDALTYSKTYRELIHGHTYRAHIVSWPWSNVTLDTSAYYAFVVRSYDITDAMTVLVNEGCDAAELAAYYDFTVPDDSEYIKFGGRVNDGQQGIVEVEDITELDALAEDTRAFHTADLPPQVILSSKMFNAAGNIISESSIDLYKYVVTAGESYLFTGSRPSSGSSYVYLIAWYNNEETYISKEGYRSTATKGISLNDVKITAPAGAAYAFINVYKARKESYSMRHINRLHKGQDVADKADYAYGYLNGINFELLEADPVVVSGAAISAVDGSIVNLTSGIKYAEIAVAGASAIRFLGIQYLSSPTTYGYAFYDENDDMIASYSWDAGAIVKSREYTVAVPESAVTFRTTFNVTTDTAGLLASEEDFYIIRVSGNTMVDTLKEIEEAESRPLGEVRIAGKGNTYSGKRIYSLLPMHRYRLYIKSWPADEVPVSALAKFYAEWNDGNQWTSFDLKANLNKPLKPYYDITIPATAQYISLGGRLNNGAVGIVDIQDISVSSGAAIQRNRIRARRIISAQTIGQIPLNIPADEDGWELPTTVQQLNIVKKALQMCRIKWTPKSSLPGRNDPTGTAHEQGVQQTGIPYSSNWHNYKHVGIEVSFHTFMTAVNNPYSLLYTENINKSKSKSAWGYTYYNPNGWMYYGTVCCAFTSGVHGMPTKYDNSMIPMAGALFGVFVPLEPERDVDVLRVGDIYNNPEHSILILGLHRDSNGKVDRILKAESTSAVNSCRIMEYTRADFIAAYHRKSYYAYRIPDDYKNLNYEYSPYVPLEEYGEEETTVTYNNDICCFAGDRATFMAGDKVAVNYNLAGTPSREWTGIEVYKDNTLLATYTLSAIDQSQLDNSQKNHALYLGTSLAPGKYKARMTDGSNYSAYTYWEVLANDITVSYRGNDNYRLSSTGSQKIRYVYCGQTQEGGWFLNRCGREPDFYESKSNAINLYFDSIITEWGFDPTNYNQIRVLIQGSYGMAATPPITLPGHSTDPGDEDGEDPHEEDDDEPAAS